jgi:hypothetical protein
LNESTHAHSRAWRTRNGGHDTIGTMQDALETPPAPASGITRSPVWRLVGLLVLAGLIVGLATWQVGPSPRPADEGLPSAPPPLVLPSDVPDDSALSRAAAELAAGQLTDARRGFTAIVAEDREGEPGQVGLVLSRWRSTGPVSVERDLQQLANEYPDSAYVALHLATVQLLLDDPRAARETLRTARELGLKAADPTSLRMARLAEDLLHPSAFRGTMPVLVQLAEVTPTQRAATRRLLAAVAAGDRRAVTRLAGPLERSDDPFARLAAVAARFDKGEPAPTVDALERLARTGETPALRDRARFLATLAELWGGGDRPAGCAELATLARTAQRDTRRLAEPIHGELCRS